MPTQCFLKLCRRHWYIRARFNTPFLCDIHYPEPTPTTMGEWPMPTTATGEKKKKEGKFPATPERAGDSGVLRGTNEYVFICAIVCFKVTSLSLCVVLIDVVKGGRG